MGAGASIPNPLVLDCFEFLVKEELKTTDYDPPRYWLPDCVRIVNFGSYPRLRVNPDTYVTTGVVVTSHIHCLVAAEPEETRAFMRIAKNIIAPEPRCEFTVHQNSFREVTLNPDIFSNVVQFLDDDAAYNLGCVKGFDWVCISHALLFHPSTCLHLFKDHNDEMSEIPRTVAKIQFILRMNMSLSWDIRTQMRKNGFDENIIDEVYLANLCYLSKRGEYFVHQYDDGESFTPADMNMAAHRTQRLATQFETFIEERFDGENIPHWELVKLINAELQMNSGVLGGDSITSIHIAAQGAKAMAPYWIYDMHTISAQQVAMGSVMHFIQMKTQSFQDWWMWHEKMVGVKNYDDGYIYQAYTLFPTITSYNDEYHPPFISYDMNKIIYRHVPQGYEFYTPSPRCLLNGMPFSCLMLLTLKPVGLKMSEWFRFKELILNK